MNNKIQLYILFSIIILIYWIFKYYQSNKESFSNHCDEQFREDDNFILNKYTNLITRGLDTRISTSTNKGTICIGQPLDKQGSISDGCFSCDDYRKHLYSFEINNTNDKDTTQTIMRRTKEFNSDISNENRLKSITKKVGISIYFSFNESLECENNLVPSEIISFFDEQVKLYHINNTKSIYLVIKSSSNTCDSNLKHLKACDNTIRSTIPIEYIHNNNLNHLFIEFKIVQDEILEYTIFINGFKNTFLDRGYTGVVQNCNVNFILNSKQIIKKNTENRIETNLSIGAIHFLHKFYSIGDNIVKRNTAAVYVTQCTNILSLLSYCSLLDSCHNIGYIHILASWKFYNLFKPNEYLRTTTNRVYFTSVILNNLDETRKLLIETEYRNELKKIFTPSNNPDSDTIYFEGKLYKIEEKILSKNSIYINIANTFIEHLYRNEFILSMGVKKQDDVESSCRYRELLISGICHYIATINILAKGILPFSSNYINKTKYISRDFNNNLNIEVENTGNTNRLTINKFGKVNTNNGEEIKRFIEHNYNKNILGIVPLCFNHRFVFGTTMQPFNYYPVNQTFLLNGIGRSDTKISNSRGILIHTDQFSTIGLSNMYIRCNLLKLRNINTRPTNFKDVITRMNNAFSRIPATITYHKENTEISNGLKYDTYRYKNIVRYKYTESIIKSSFIAPISKNVGITEIFVNNPGQSIRHHWYGYIKGYNSLHFKMEHYINPTVSGYKQSNLQHGKFIIFIKPQNKSMGEYGYVLENIDQTILIQLKDHGINAENINSKIVMVNIYFIPSNIPDSNDNFKLELKIDNNISDFSKFKDNISENINYLKIETGQAFSKNDIIVLDNILFPLYNKVIGYYTQNIHSVNGLNAAAVNSRKPKIEYPLSIFTENKKSPLVSVNINSTSSEQLFANSDSMTHIQIGYFNIYGKSLNMSVSNNHFDISNIHIHYKELATNEFKFHSIKELISTNFIKSCKLIRSDTNSDLDIPAPQCDSKDMIFGANSCNKLTIHNVTIDYSPIKKGITDDNIKYGQQNDICNDNICTFSLPIDLHKGHWTYEYKNISPYLEFTDSQNINIPNYNAFKLNSDMNLYERTFAKDAHHRSTNNLVPFSTNDRKFIYDYTGRICLENESRPGLPDITKCLSVSNNSLILEDSVRLNELQQKGLVHNHDISKFRINNVNKNITTMSKDNRDYLNRHAYVYLYYMANQSMIEKKQYMPKIKIYWGSQEISTSNIEDLGWYRGKHMPKNMYRCGIVIKKQYWSSEGKEYPSRIGILIHGLKEIGTHNLKYIEYDFGNGISSKKIPNNSDDFPIKDVEVYQSKCGMRQLFSVNSFNKNQCSPALLAVTKNINIEEYYLTNTPYPIPFCTIEKPKYNVTDTIFDYACSRQDLINKSDLSTVDTSTFKSGCTSDFCDPTYEQCKPSSFERVPEYSGRGMFVLNSINAYTGLVVKESSEVIHSISFRLHFRVGEQRYQSQNTWSHILRLTPYNENVRDNLRPLAIWFMPNQKRLHIRCGTITNSNYGLDTPILSDNLECLDIKCTFTLTNFNVELNSKQNLYSGVLGKKNDILKLNTSQSFTENRETLDSNITNTNFEIFRHNHMYLYIGSHILDSNYVYTNNTNAVISQVRINKYPKCRAGSFIAGLNERAWNTDEGETVVPQDIIHQISYEDVSKSKEQSFQSKQDDYRGNTSVTTVNNTPCQKWTNQYPHSHSRTPQNYPNSGLGDHNFCRNPDGEPFMWCYTTDPNIRWEQCKPIPAPLKLANNLSWTGEFVPILEGDYVFRLSTKEVNTAELFIDDFNTPKLQSGIGNEQSDEYVFSNAIPGSIHNIKVRLTVNNADDMYIKFEVKQPEQNYSIDLKDIMRVPCKTQISENPSLQSTIILPLNRKDTEQTIDGLNVIAFSHSNRLTVTKGSGKNGIQISPNTFIFPSLDQSKKRLSIDSVSFTADQLKIPEGEKTKSISNMRTTQSKHICYNTLEDAQKVFNSNISIVEAWHNDNPTCNSMICDINGERVSQDKWLSSTGFESTYDSRESHLCRSNNPWSSVNYGVITEQSCRQYCNNNDKCTAYETNINKDDVNYIMSARVIGRWFGGINNSIQPGVRYDTTHWIFYTIDNIYIKMIKVKFRNVNNLSQDNIQSNVIQNPKPETKYADNIKLGFTGLLSTNQINQAWSIGTNAPYSDQSSTKPGYSILFNSIKVGRSSNTGNCWIYESKNLYHQPSTSENTCNIRQFFRNGQVQCPADKCYSVSTKECATPTRINKISGSNSPADNYEIKYSPAPNTLPKLDKCYKSVPQSLIFYNQCNITHRNIVIDAGDSVITYKRPIAIQQHDDTNGTKSKMLMIKDKYDTAIIDDMFRLTQITHIQLPRSYTMKITTNTKPDGIEINGNDEEKSVPNDVTSIEFYPTYQNDIIILSKCFNDTDLQNTRVQLLSQNITLYYLKDVYEFILRNNTNKQKSDIVQYIHNSIQPEYKIYTIDPNGSQLSGDKLYLILKYKEALIEKNNKDKAMITGASTIFNAHNQDSSVLSKIDTIVSKIDANSIFSSGMDSTFYTNSQQNALSNYNISAKSLAFNHSQKCMDEGLDNMAQSLAIHLKINRNTDKVQSNNNMITIGEAEGEFNNKTIKPSKVMCPAGFSIRDIEQDPSDPNNFRKTCVKIDPHYTTSETNKIDTPSKFNTTSDQNYDSCYTNCSNIYEEQYPEWGGVLATMSEGGCECIRADDI